MSGNRLVGAPLLPDTSYLIMTQSSIQTNKYNTPSDISEATNEKSIQRTNIRKVRGLLNRDIYTLAYCTITPSGALIL